MLLSLLLINKYSSPLFATFLAKSNNKNNKLNCDKSSNNNNNNNKLQQIIILLTVLKQFEYSILHLITYNLLRMAQLFRYLYSDDRQKSEIFTFMIPSNFILDTDTDLKSRDFTASCQKWSLSFFKNNGSINAFLTLKSALEGMCVQTEYAITLINREHFTKNEAFIEKNAKFTFDNSIQGRKGFATIEALCTLDFMDERGNIQCELEIKNVNTQFAYDLQLSPASFGRQNPNDLKFVTGSFVYGNYEWNICIQPKLDNTGGISYLKFYLCRLSALDHLCRISFRYKLTNGNYNHDSGVIEQYSDINGASNSYRLDKARELLQADSGKFNIRLELVKINSIFPIILYPLAQMPEPVQFYDRDRQAWVMESCIEDNCFILRLFYSDINNIPSGYVRVVSFNISVRHQQTGPVNVFKKPVIKYYYKRDTDDGLEITTTVDVNEMTSENNGYLDQDGGITIEMEWNYSHLLNQPEYSHLDDITRKQKIQMLREIQTLQQENYTLEKQLVAVQQLGPNVPTQHQPMMMAASTNNTSTSSTSSSGVGTSISSNTTINSMQNNNMMMNQNQNQMMGNQNMLNSPNMMGNQNMMNNQMNPNQQTTPTQPDVVKKYMEQRYGSNTNMAGAPSAGPGTNSPNQQQQQTNNGIPKMGTGLLGDAFGGASNLFGGGGSKLFGGGEGGASNLLSGPANLLGGSNLLSGAGASGAAGAATAGLSSLKSSFTSGFANLKLSATSNPITGGFTSKLLNPFSSNSSPAPPS